MIQRLLISNIRVLSQVELNELAECNVFVGKNGSGKTSLLESIFLLSRGKSFRHHQPKHYIAHGHIEATVFAQFRHTGSMAVAKSVTGESKLRLNAANVTTQSELTRELPVILLDPTQLDVLDHGSSERRSLLDWLVFHIQPNFYKTWLNYQRAIKQRNRILREYERYADLSASIRMQLHAWDEQLAQLGNQIHRMRADVVAQWQPIFQQVCAQFLPQYDNISMRYNAGFDTELGLQQVLAERTEKDVELGYTRVGAHRADVMFYSESTITDNTHAQPTEKTLKRSAPDVFSRGEKKLLIMALKLSQLTLLKQCEKHAIVLLDDINAELDEGAVERLLVGLHDCHSQLFITSLTNNMMPLVNNLWGVVAQFDIANGMVRSVA